MLPHVIKNSIVQCNGLIKPINNILITEDNENVIPSIGITQIYIYMYVDYICTSLKSHIAKGYYGCH